MNRVAKGAVAAGAAAVLLAGGAGTFALWSDQATVAGGTITAGHLSLDITGGQWSDISSGTPTTFDPEFDEIVPGDVVQYTATAVVEGDGKNLQAQLVADTADIGGDLAPYLEITLGVDTTFTQSLTYDLGHVDGTTLHPVVLTFEFPESTPLTEGMGTTLSLNDFELALEQTTP
ncbi:alternate-type signal peptide domain-containing protein [Herbiconiux liangxiaofengii]|uniref:alternate-type signal peptide domain-containing protein n=1 Tax=Herbiconiux liangxiaofengii TaxID=3342795 RepID=UPI0035BB51E7